MVSVFLGQVKLSPLALAFLALLKKFHLCNETSSLLLQCMYDQLFSVFGLCKNFKYFLLPVNSLCFFLFHS